MVAALKGLARKGIAAVLSFCDTIVPGGAARLLSQIDRDRLEQALFCQAPVRRFGELGNVLKANPPSSAVTRSGHPEFYHLLPWLYRSNALIDVFVCEHQISEGLFLYEMCRRKQDGVLVEVGRRLGGSTVVMASALDRGRLYSLDILPLDDATLLSYLKTLGLADRVELLAAPSYDFVPPGSCGIDLLFLDGCKDSDEAVRSDVEHFLPFLKPGSYLLMHDYNELPVQRAVEDLTRTRFQLVDQVGLLVCLQAKG